MATPERRLGGLFRFFNTLPSLVQEVVKLAGDLGVKLTPAGATFSYGIDPEDRNIRLALSFPGVEDVDSTMQAFVICVKLAFVRQRIQQLNG